jgi:hypothetical protein
LPKIDGRVVEKYTRRPVSGAIVTVNGHSTYTNSNGTFSVQAPMGSVSLRIEHRDFSPYVKSLNITRGIVHEGMIKMDSIIRAL